MAYVLVGLRVGIYLTRRYAKRQYTWFKNQMDVHWFTYTDAAIENEIKRWLEQWKKYL